MRALITQRESLDRNGSRIDSLEAEYVEYFESLGIRVCPVPNYMGDMAEYARDSGCRMLILSGGGVLPDYGYDRKLPCIPAPYRDKTENALITWALENGFPILGICRGMQKLNSYFGGISTRNPEWKMLRMIREEHPVVLEGSGGRILVNHFHSDVILKEDLAEDLLPTAMDAENHTVEAFVHRTKKIAGVQWHPERSLETCKARRYSEAIIRNLI